MDEQSEEELGYEMQSLNHEAQREQMISELQEGNRNLQAENKTLKELLRIAICPNAVNGCKDGILINPYGEPEQCKWCDITKQALK